MCLGTHLGSVYLLDHQGNMVDKSMEKKLKFSSHLISVNQISIDNGGEYIGTCSDDAMVNRLVFIYVQHFFYCYFFF